MILWDTAKIKYLTFNELHLINRKSVLITIIAIILLTLIAYGIGSGGDDDRNKRRIRFKKEFLGSFSFAVFIVANYLILFTASEYFSNTAEVSYDADIRDYPRTVQELKESGGSKKISGLKVSLSQDKGENIVHVVDQITHSDLKKSSEKEFKIQYNDLFEGIMKRKNDNLIASDEASLEISKQQEERKRVRKLKSMFRERKNNKDKVYTVDEYYSASR